jgi:hypothetical protein
LHGNESVGFEGAEDQSDARSLGEVAPFVAPHVLLPVNGPEFVQGAEDFVWQRHHDIFNLPGELLNVYVLWRLGRLRAQRHANEGDNSDIEVFKDLGHRELRLLISRPYSGLMEDSKQKWQLHKSGEPNILTFLNRPKFTLPASGVIV